MKKNILMTLLCLLGMATENTYAQTVFKHTAATTNTQGNYTHINNKSTNNKSDAVIFVTHSFGGTSTFIKSPLGVWYDKGKWAIFRQDRKALKVGNTFNVLVFPEKHKKAFRHTANSNNTSAHITTIDHPAANGKPDAKLIVTQYWGSSRYNNHPIGIYYQGGKWRIYNQDFAKMPQNAMFNVLVDYDKTYQHTATQQNIVVHTSILDRQKTENNDCLFVTQLWKGVYNAHPVAIGKAGKKWMIYNENGKPMPKSAMFNVLALSSSGGDGTSGDGGIVSNILTASNIKLPFLSKYQNIQYEIVDGMAVYQNDIILGRASQIRNLPKPKSHPRPITLEELRAKYANGSVGSNSQPLVATNDAERKWDRGIIPYVISSEFSRREQLAILNNINDLDQRTNLTLTPRAGHPDYIYFDKANLSESVAGNSRLGRTGGRQDINLNANGNWVGNRTVTHEILHAIGVYHEHMRSDRDRYVEVNRSDVKLRFRHNFSKCDYEDSELCGPYDVNSIMHYNGCAFVDCGAGDEPSIIDRRTGRPVSAGSRLSSIDVDCINIFYPEDARTGLSPDLETLRNVKLTVRNVNSYNREGGITAKAPDFYVISEIGEGLTWRPGEERNSTQTHRTATVDNRMNIRPNWEINAPIPAGASVAKVVLKLHDEDGTVIDRYDVFDINPRRGDDYKYLSLMIDLNDGQIWLVDNRFARAELIGYTGEDIQLEGYNDEAAALITFNLSVSNRR